jgi:predicted CXXCH cytochrome family protein
MLWTLLLALLICPLSLLAQVEPVAPVLDIADCAKCHELQPMEIAANGGAHKTQINCRDCHAGHRPAVANNIPQCGMCHSGGKHYELEGCVTCHNPHQPMQVTLKGELTTPCLTCHAEVGEELIAHASKHTELACSTCHAERHGNIPSCGACHEPHSAQMTQNDCGVCHLPHQPLTLKYGPQTASVFCASCHDQAFNLLAASKAKHHDIACVTCHQSQHKTIPRCNDCHGLPHPEAMHQMFPNCATCHNIAHDLNNLPAQKESKEAAGKGAAPGKATPKNSKKAK